MLAVSFSSSFRQRVLDIVSAWLSTFAMPHTALKGKTVTRKVLQENGRFDLLFTFGTSDFDVNGRKRTRRSAIIKHQGSLVIFSDECRYTLSFPYLNEERFCE
jgi:hypothetical protein